MYHYHTSLTLKEFPPLSVARAHINLLKDIYFLGRPEVARAVEVVVGGLALPLLCYAWMPAYRAFGACPDQRDLRMVLKAEGRQLRIGHESSLSLCSSQRPVQGGTRVTA